MYFVSQQRVKIIGILLLLLNITGSLAESPASSYLPPSNGDDQSGRFSSGNPTGQNYNSNSAPIETSVSLTTSEPFSYNPSSFGDSGSSRNPPANTYGAPNSQNLPNSGFQSNLRGNGNQNNANFNRASPIRNQQSLSGNSGYSYQQPSPPFKEPGQFASIGVANAGQGYPAPQQSTFGGQNYQSLGPSNSPQSNSFGQVGGQNVGQGYQSAGATNSAQPTSFSQIGSQNGGPSYQSTGPINSPQTNTFGLAGSQNAGQGYQSASPTNTPIATSTNYFSSPLPSLSPTYGAPSNTSGGYPGGRGNAPSFSANLLDRKPTPSSSNPQPGSFRPSPNQPPISGNAQGFSQNLPGLSTSYGPPSPAGVSFGNFPPFGGSFNPFGSNNSPLNQNRNPFSSSGPANTPSGRPLSSFGAPIAPQTLYGAPTPNNFADGGNSPGRRPSTAFGAGLPPQTLYSSSMQTPADRFSPQSNRNKGTFGPPSPTYGPPANTRPLEGNAQSFRPEEFERLNQNTRPFENPITGYQNTSSLARPAPSQSYGAPSSNSPNAGYNRGQTQQGSYPSSNGPPPSVSPGLGQNKYNPVQNQVRPSSPSFGPPSPGYSQNLQNQPPQPPSPTYGLPQSQNSPSQVSSFNTFNSPSSSGFGATAPYETSRSPSNSISPSSGFGTGGGYDASRLPTNAVSSNSGFGTSTGYEAPRSPSNVAPTGPGFSTGGSYEAPRSPNSGIGNSLSPLYGTPSTNSFNQGFTSPNNEGYASGPSSSTGFGNVSPTTESAQSINSISLSPSYGTPTRDYTDAILGDYNTPTSAEQGNTFFGNANSFEQYASPGGNVQSSQNPSANQEIPAQSAYSAFSPNPSSFSEQPSRPYDSSRPSNEFTNDVTSPQFTHTGSTNVGTQSEPNFSTNPASSYLPPAQPANTGTSDDIVASTSYTLPSDQPNSARPGASNAVKNPNRNVGSDLITGASTSPFLPFKDDLSKPSAAAPSRATYEKSQEITSNDLGTTGYDSAKPAKYQFNYDVKGSGPEFSHQESRNGTTTSGSYDVVLPDGRKQVVDYEANQEGFHPKIRYEETPNNSLQQNNDQNQGYSYSPNTSPAQNFSQSFAPNIDSELQPPYPSRPDYSLGTAANQGSYTSPYSQSGYSNNDQGSESNFNTYSNQGTSPGNPDESTYNSSGGYPAKSAPEQIPFYT